MSETVLLPALILATARLSSSVGHAGASGYVAIMALFGMAPGVMKQAALAPNVLLAAIATVRFGRAGFPDTVSGPASQPGVVVSSKV